MLLRQRLILKSHFKGLYLNPVIAFILRALLPSTRTSLPKTFELFPSTSKCANIKQHQVAFSKNYTKNYYKIKTFSKCLKCYLIFNHEETRNATSS